MTDVPLTFTHHRADTAKELVESVIVKLYVASHSESLSDPFYSVERFVERVRGYLRSPGFELVVGAVGDAPVGLALGYALPPGARWWNGLTTPVDPEFTEEDGRRTFGLNELMVHPSWQARGIGHAIHDELFDHRGELRASLTVDPDNTNARQAYLRWGWRQVGKVQPFPDSPVYDLLVLDLVRYRARLNSGG